MITSACARSLLRHRRRPRRRLRSSPGRRARRPCRPAEVVHAAPEVTAMCAGGLLVRLNTWACARSLQRSRRRRRQRLRSSPRRRRRRPSRPVEGVHAAVEHTAMCGSLSSLPRCSPCDARFSSEHVLHCFPPPRHRRGRAESRAPPQRCPLAATQTRCCACDFSRYAPHLEGRQCAPPWRALPAAILPQTLLLDLRTSGKSQPFFEICGFFLYSSLWRLLRMPILRPFHLLPYSFC